MYVCVCDVQRKFKCDSIANTKNGANNLRICTEDTLHENPLGSSTKGELCAVRWANSSDGSEVTRSQQHHGNMTSLQWRWAGHFRGFNSSLIRCHLKLPTLKYSRSTTEAISSRVRVNSNTFRVFALWQILTFPQTGSWRPLPPPLAGARVSRLPFLFFRFECFRFWAHRSSLGVLLAFHC